MKMGVASVLGCSLFVFAGLALGAASFQDAAGDDNAAPDVTSVTVSEAADGTISVALAIRNFQSLPANSWFNVWFDIDSNQDTGDAGDEVLVRYVEGGELELWVWDGGELAERPTTGMTGQFAAGVLTVTAPKSALGNDSTFGVLAVSSRAQELGETEFIASDYAPDRGRSAYVGPTLAAFPDPGDDEESAPDITAVRVTDTKDGWISFAISTPNDVTMPVDSVMLLVIDSDNRASTGAGGAELAVTHAVRDVVVERWNPRTREWGRDPAPNRVRARSAGNVVTIDVHRSELDDSARFGLRGLVGRHQHRGGLGRGRRLRARRRRLLPLHADQQARSPARRGESVRNAGAASSRQAVHGEPSGLEVGHEAPDRLRERDLQRHRRRRACPRDRPGEGWARPVQPRRPSQGERAARLADRPLGRQGRQPRRSPSASARPKAEPQHRASVSGSTFGLGWLWTKG